MESAPRLSQKANVTPCQVMEGGCWSGEALGGAWWTDGGGGDPQWCGSWCVWYWGAVLVCLK